MSQRFSDIDCLEIMHRFENEGEAGTSIARDYGCSHNSIMGLIHRIRSAHNMTEDTCEMPQNMDGGMPERWWE